MFETLSASPKDPILSLMSAFQADTRPNKVDLGVGVYRDETGHTPMMSAIHQAAQQQYETQSSKSYLGLLGNVDFNEALVQAVFGDLAAGRRGVMQTPGASGALRLLAELIKTANNDVCVWLSDPSYVNHAPIFRAAGCRVAYFPFLDRQTQGLDRVGLWAALKVIPKGDVVLMHGCCHNPTGLRLTEEDWRQFAHIAHQRQFVPLIDLAYQGLGDGWAQDGSGVRHLVSVLDNVLVAYSCSKNFALYRERTGAAMLFLKNEAEAKNALGRLQQLARQSYTMPPDHGADLVCRVLSQPTLQAEWAAELTLMRERIQTMRHLLVEKTQALGCDKFHFILQHQGMFSLTGFSPEQIARLKQEFAIYLVGDGRLNFAGLSSHQMDWVAKAFVSVSND